MAITGKEDMQRGSTTLLVLSTLVLLAYHMAIHILLLSGMPLMYFPFTSLATKLLLHGMHIARLAGHGGIRAYLQAIHYDGLFIGDRVLGDVHRMVRVFVCEYRLLFYGLYIRQCRHGQYLHRKGVPDSSTVGSTFGVYLTGIIGSLLYDASEILLNLHIPCFIGRHILCRAVSGTASDSLLYHVCGLTMLGNTGLLHGLALNALVVPLTGTVLSLLLSNAAKLVLVAMAVCRSEIDTCTAVMLDYVAGHILRRASDTDTCASECSTDDIFMSAIDTMDVSECKKITDSRNMSSHVSACLCRAYDWCNSRVNVLALALSAAVLPVLYHANMHTMSNWLVIVSLAILLMNIRRCSRPACALLVVLVLCGVRLSRCVCALYWLVKAYGILREYPAYHGVLSRLSFFLL